MLDPNKTRVQASTKQVAWVGQLYSAKGLLKGVTSEVTGPPGDAFAEAAAQQNVDQYFADLQDFIEVSNVTNQHETARDIANDRLGNFAQSITGISSASVAKVLSGAQSARISLNSGITSDSQLSGKCLLFINAVENLESFDAMEDFFNSLFGGLENSDLGSQLAGMLRMGSISSLLAEFGLGEDFASWLLSCYVTDGLDEQDVDKLIKEKMAAIQKQVMEALSAALQIPSLPEFEAWKKKKDQILKNLQDK